MLEFTQYFGNVEGIRGRFTGLPPWARFIVGVFALPGIALAIIALLIFALSIVALLIITLPVYSLLRNLTSPAPQIEPERAGVKHVEVTVIDPPHS